MKFHSLKELLLVGDCNIPPFQLVNKAGEEDIINFTPCLQEIHEVSSFP